MILIIGEKQMGEIKPNTRKSYKKRHDNRGCCKTSVLQQQPLRNAVLQPVGRKTARACAKVTDFCNRLNNIRFDYLACDHIF
jgi:hypothetical protein